MLYRVISGIQILEKQEEEEEQWESLEVDIWWNRVTSVDVSAQQNSLEETWQN